MNSNPGHSDTANDRKNGLSCAYPGCTKSRRTLDFKFFVFPKVIAAQMKQWSQILGIPVADAMVNSYIICADHFDKNYIGKVRLLKNAIPKTPDTFNDNLLPNNICQLTTANTSDMAIISQDNKQIIFESITSTYPNNPSEIPPLILLPSVSDSKYSGASGPPPLHLIDNVASNISGYAIPNSAVQIDTPSNATTKTEHISEPNIGNSENATLQISNAVSLSLLQDFSPPPLQLIGSICPKPIAADQPVINDAPKNDDISFTNFPPLRLISSTTQPSMDGSTIQQHTESNDIVKSSIGIPPLQMVENPMNQDMSFTNFPPLRLISPVEESSTINKLRCDSINSFANSVDPPSFQIIGSGAASIPVYSIPINSFPNVINENNSTIEDIPFTNFPPLRLITPVERSSIVASESKQISAPASVAVLVNNNAASTIPTTFSHTSIPSKYIESPNRIEIISKPPNSTTVPSVQKIENVPSNYVHPIPIRSPVGTVTNEEAPPNKIDNFPVEQSFSNTNATMSSAEKRRIAGNKCTYPLCKYSKRFKFDKDGKRVRFFRFPFNDETRLLKWCQIVGKNLNEVGRGQLICEKHFEEKDLLSRKLKVTALPKKPRNDLICEKGSTIGQTGNETKIEYLPVEESPLNDIIFIPAEQPIKIEDTDMVHAEAPIVVSTLKSVGKIARAKLRTLNDPETAEIQKADKSRTKKVITLDHKMATNSTTKNEPENGCKKCAQLLAVELKVKENIATHEEKHESEEPLATEKRNHVYKLRKQYQLQKKIARRKRKTIASLGEQLKIEHHRYGLLKTIANDQAEFVRKISYSKRPKIIAKQIKTIITIKKPEKKRQFVAVYIVT